VSTPPPSPAPVADEPSLEALGRGGRATAWHFAPCIGTWQGLINPVLVSVPTVLLKSLGFSNAVVGYATLATLPMALKFLLGPIVDTQRTRRWWCVNAGAWLMVCVVILAVPLMMPAFSIWLYLAALFLLALVKSIHQVALNGFFTLSLTKSEQALFSGLDPMWGRAATIFSGSILLAIVGGVAERYHDPRITWGLYTAGLLAVFVPLYFYTRWSFPHPAADRVIDPATRQAGLPYGAMLRSYFALPALLPGAAFLFFMRSGETILAKMGVAFLMDAPGAGGYGLSIAEVGVFTGVMTACGITGGAIAGVVLRKHGLRRVVWPFSLAAVLPNIIYVYLALHPSSGNAAVDWDLTSLGAGVWHLDFTLLALLGLESFGFGLGFTVMNFYMFRMAANSPYPASHVALSASVVYTSYLLFGMISGICQEWLGYPGLFILSIVVSLPAFAAIPFLNYALDERKK
jgi:PAT family beta-lactamase induction signal transducer AmpG